jgi:hypothetical protein
MLLAVSLLAEVRNHNSANGRSTACEQFNRNHALFTRRSRFCKSAGTSFSAIMHPALFELLIV